MRRLLLVLAGCGFLTLTACDILERDGKEKSDAEQAVSTARDLVPPGTVRTLLDLLSIGLGAYATRKGFQADKQAKDAKNVQASTEAREYNADEALSMHNKMAELGLIAAKAK